LHGGYSLSRPPGTISVADIVDALEEQPFGLTECSAVTGLCDIEDTCRIRASWRTINSIVRRALQDVSVASMVQPLPNEQRVSFGPSARVASTSIRTPARRAARPVNAAPE
jgi:DNA-binding IscR family transcriptional regulator